MLAPDTHSLCQLSAPYPPADFAGMFRSFTSGFTRAEGMFTLVLGGLMVVAGVVLEPVTSAWWEARNEGVSLSCPAPAIPPLLLPGPVTWRRGHPRYCSRWLGDCRLAP